jgi:hypothetical protein
MVNEVLTPEAMIKRLQREVGHLTTQLQHQERLQSGAAQPMDVIAATRERVEMQERLSALQVRELTELTQP